MPETTYWHTSSSSQLTDSIYMPARKVFSNGWVFWLAKHPEYGVILFDRTDQDEVPSGSVRVFAMRGKSRQILPREVLKAETSAEISDGDFVCIVTAYNELKHSLGKPLKASGQDAIEWLEHRHKRFLSERGLPDRGIRPATSNRTHRITHCWSCTKHLDNSVDVECIACRWIICQCGACGCGRIVHPNAGMVA